MITCVTVLAHLMLSRVSVCQKIWQIVAKQHVQKVHIQSHGISVIFDLYSGLCRFSNCWLGAAMPQ